MPPPRSCMAAAGVHAGPSGVSGRPPMRGRDWTGVGAAHIGDSAWRWGLALIRTLGKEEALLSSV